MFRRIFQRRTHQVTQHWSGKILRFCGQQEIAPADEMVHFSAITKATIILEIREQWLKLRSV